MNKTLDLMSQVLNLQKQVFAELEQIVNIEKKETMADRVAGKNSQVFINAAHLEDIEKYYYMLDKINQNTYALLDMSKKQKDKLYKYSTNIRKHLLKEKHIKNENMFITVLDSHFSGNLNGVQFNPEQHREMYESIQRYHELHTDLPKTNYVLQKSVKLPYKDKILSDDYFVEIPVVESLGDMQCMFNWYAGDIKHEAGVYVCISPNFHIQVPFPDLISKDSRNFKHKSVPCKYKTLENCHMKQIEYSKIYGTSMRQCNFVHVGESFIKIGSDYRCPNLPSFGAFDSLCDDLVTVPLSDIKTILMNSSSDLLLVKLWQQYHMNLGELTLMHLDKLLM